MKSSREQIIKGMEVLNCEFVIENFSKNYLGGFLFCQAKNDPQFLLILMLYK